MILVDKECLRAPNWGEKMNKKNPFCQWYWCKVNFTCTCQRSSVRMVLLHQCSFFFWSQNRNNTNTKGPLDVTAILAACEKCLSPCSWRTTRLHLGICSAWAPVHLPSSLILFVILGSLCWEWNERSPNSFGFCLSLISEHFCIFSLARKAFLILSHVRFLFVFVCSFYKLRFLSRSMETRMNAKCV